MMRHVLCVLFTFFLGWAALAASLSAKHYGSQYKYWKLTRYDARGEVTSVSSGVL